MLILIASPAAAESLAGHGPSPAAVTLESLVLPGLGQASNGKWLKSGLFLGSYAGFLAWGISINQDVQDARGRLNAAPEGDRYALTLEVNGLENGRSAKYWFAGLTFLLSMVDAYVDAHLHGFDQRIDAQVGMIPEGDGPLWGVRVTLPIGGPGEGGT